LMSTVDILTDHSRINALRVVIQEILTSGTRQQP
jgi:hypothetical protein